MSYPITTSDECKETPDDYKLAMIGKFCIDKVVPCVPNGHPSIIHLCLVDTLEIRGWD
jgi:hypothetical protein